MKFKHNPNKEQTGIAEELANFQEMEESLTAIVQAMYPGFSRGSILAHSRTNSPTYHGIAPRKKPIINLQEGKNKLLKQAIKWKKKKKKLKRFPHTRSIP